MPPLGDGNSEREPQRGFEPLTCRLQVDCATLAPQGRHGCLDSITPQNGPVHSRGHLVAYALGLNYIERRVKSQFKKRLCRFPYNKRGPSCAHSPAFRHSLAPPTPAPSHQFYRAVMPPSITSSLPVTKADSSEARYRIPSAMSWGVPNRPSGVFASRSCRTSGMAW